MVIENPIPPFFEWIPTAFLTWGAVVGALTIGVVLLAFIIISVTHGPKAAAVRIGDAIAGGVGDLWRMSLRRILALAWLSFAETFRRRVWVSLVVFLVVLGFAAWFLRPEGGNAANVYLTFVLTATTYLVLWMALFISVFSLPNDIAKKTIFTLATKPVRTCEIVLGRILGFTAVGTLLLTIMGLFSYLFVIRQLGHRHEVDPTEIQALKSGRGVQGRTSEELNHRHTFQLDANGEGDTSIVAGHWHRVRASERDGKAEYAVGPPAGDLAARVPVYGKLRFRDDRGGDAVHATNVGYEWTYREFIEGGTQAAAIWTFADITPERFPEGLKFNMTFEVFRTYKGNVERGIPGELVLRNPHTGYELLASLFTPVEAPHIHEEFVPRKLTEQGSTIRTVDLFENLVDADGNLEVEIRCVPPAQFFGMGQADLYILAKDAVFGLNMVKGHFGIWLQMLLLTTIGVMFSTFLNGPVSMLATAATLFGGYGLPFMRGLVSGQQLGGGPAESTIRIVSQRDMMTELEPGFYRTVAEGLDAVFQGVLFVVTAVLVNLSALSDVDWVASGFDIPANNVLVHLLTTLGYFVPLFLVGHFILRKRELAK